MRIAVPRLIASHCVSPGLSCRGFTLLILIVVLGDAGGFPAIR